MKKFKFNLASVLRQREIVEDLRKKDLGDAQKALEYAREDLEFFKSQKTETYKAKEMLSLNEFSMPQEYEIFEQFIKGMNYKIEKQRELIRQLEVDVQNKRLRYIESYKKKKIIQNLEDKKKQEHHKTELKLEEKKLSDLITIRHEIQKKIYEVED